MTLENIKTIVGDGIKTVAIETRTQPKLLKKSRIDGTPTPIDWKKVELVSTFKAAVGESYSDICKAFNIGPSANPRPSGKHHITTAILQSDKDENKHYLAVRLIEPVSSKLLVNDEEVNGDKAKEIREGYLPKHTPHDNNKPQIMTIGLDSIVKMAAL